MNIQASHEMLLKLLEKHPDFNSKTGRWTFVHRKEPLSADEVRDFGPNEPSAAVVLMLTALNIRSGSAGQNNFYRLMEAYLRVPEYRERMNRVSDEALSHLFQETEH